MEGRRNNGLEESSRTNKYYISTSTKNVKKTNIYQFDNFGKLHHIPNGRITTLRGVDIDGDGDIDLVVGTDEGDLFLYENTFKENK